MYFFSLLIIALPLFGSTHAALQCDDKKTLSHTLVGPNNDVSVDYIHCSNAITPGLQPIAVRSVLGTRQSAPVNVCGAPCTTNCFPGAGGGPDPNDCVVIADALLYDSQNIGPLVTLDPAANTSVITMTYQSCETFIVNQVNYALQYCGNDWASLVNSIADNCQAAENAHGDNCVADDQRWFVQVQAS
ncbi:hypothetical protein BV25DRAFT_1874966 [Artomyces pyxidatus]|uniref:Uncharacterized protein n=1 Tax=Artomyces pyxidatus TaxID=48021 RepID=A0ACB8TLQ0_9AGAM|nr:hypothetical protein BV25DRAFT_1874966 [Artomyces pyxidatus]